MADIQRPIMEGENSAFGPDYFQGPSGPARYNIPSYQQNPFFPLPNDPGPDYSGIPPYPSTINLYALGPAYNDPLRNNQAGTLDAPPVVAPVVAPVVTPIPQTNQANPVQTPVVASTASTWLVLGIAAVVTIAIFS